MSDGMPHPVTFPPWDGTVELAVDRAIQDTRSAIYPAARRWIPMIRGTEPVSTAADRVVATPRTERR